MQCTNPENYHPNGTYNGTKPPCGKCLPCLMNLRRQWAARIILERKCYDHAAFVTLTFSDEHLPSDEAELKPIFQKFIKRLRKNTGRKVRYFACLEYGTRFGRAHYHAIFFGWKVKLIPRSKRLASGKSVDIWIDEDIEDNWNLGITNVKPCDTTSMSRNISAYVAGYILKDQWNPDKTNLKHEWSLQSRKPYIGYPAIKYLERALLTESGSRQLAILGTVPKQFKYGKYSYPVPARMRMELCKRLNIPYLQYNKSDGTIIDIDGYEVRQIDAKKITHKEEAEALERKTAAKINRVRKKNADNKTG